VGRGRSAGVVWLTGLLRRRVCVSSNCHAVRLQHCYCTATQAGQYTSHCLVLKNRKMSRRNALIRITVVTNWRLIAANDRSEGHVGVWGVGRILPFIICLGVGRCLSSDWSSDRFIPDKGPSVSIEQEDYLGHRIVFSFWRGKILLLLQGIQSVGEVWK
jgi:hypothetical protein